MLYLEIKEKGTVITDRGREREKLTELEKERQS